MKKLYRTRNNRGLSTVISTILMIMVVMIGMTLLFAYVTVYAQGYKDGAGGAVMESLTIEHIILHPSGSNYGNATTIWVYNAGKIDTDINAIYVNGLSLTIESGDDLTVPVGTHASISAQASSNWLSHGEYTFQVSTNRGSNFETKIQAP